MIYSRSDLALHNTAMIQSMPKMLEGLSAFADDILSLLNATSSSIENDEELKERMALIDELYSYAKAETDVAANFASKIADRVYEYEHANLEVPEVTQSEALAFLLQDRNVKQSDLKGIAHQSVISQILHEKRHMTVEHIKGFSKFFNVPEKTFLG